MENNRGNHSFEPKERFPLTPSEKGCSGREKSSSNRQFPRERGNLFYVEAPVPSFLEALGQGTSGRFFLCSAVPGGECCMFFYRPLGYKHELFIDMSNPSGASRQLPLHKGAVLVCLIPYNLFYQTIQMPSLHGKAFGRRFTIKLLQNTIYHGQGGRMTPGGCEADGKTKGCCRSVLARSPAVAFVLCYLRKQTSRFPK